MKIYKFRWYENGTPLYKSFAFPNNTGRLIGCGSDGKKIFEGDKIQGADGKIGSAKLEAQSFIDCFKLVTQ